MTKAYKVIYYPAAMKDITSILDYISMDAPNSANNLIDKIDEAISSLSSFPNKGVRPKDFNLKSKGFRMLIIDSYIVFYLVNDESFKVEIRHFQKINKSVCLSILCSTASTEPLDSITICGTCFLV